MKKLLSYIWPFTLNTVDSDTSGKLEIVICDGKKMLFSRDANYSYGALQKVLEFALHKIDIKGIQQVLLLGLGGGSVIYSLREKFGFEGHIHAVEIDDKIISIAQNDFDIYASSHLSISKNDAYTFVQEHHNKYDLIIIDLFINNEVPSQFYSTVFCNNISKLLNQNGYFIFNIGIKGKMTEKTNEAINYFEKLPFFDTTLLKNIERTNSVLIGKKLKQK